MNPGQQNAIPTYPVLMFSKTHARSLPALFALLPLMCGIWVSYTTNQPVYAVPGLVFATIAFFVVKGVLELVELVVELLIPQ